MHRVQFQLLNCKLKKKYLLQILSTSKKSVEILSKYGIVLSFSMPCNLLIDCASNLRQLDCVVASEFAQPPPKNGSVHIYTDALVALNFNLKTTSQTLVVSRKQISLPSSTLFQELVGLPNVWTFKIVGHSHFRDLPIQRSSLI